MKNTIKTEDLRKMKTTELIRERDGMKIKIIEKVANLAQSGQKNSTEIRLMRRNIARLETLICEKLDETVSEKRKENEQ